MTSLMKTQMKEENDESLSILDLTLNKNFRPKCIFTSLSPSPPPLLKEVALLLGVLFHASKCEVSVRFTGRDNTLFDIVLLPSAIFFEFRKPIHYLPMRSEVVTASRCIPSRIWSFHLKNICARESCHGSKFRRQIDNKYTRCFNSITVC